MRTDDRSGVDDRVGANPRVLVQDDVRIQRHALGQLAAGHHVRTGVNGRACADFSVVADCRAGMYVDIGRDSRGRAHVGQRADADPLCGA